MSVENIIYIDGAFKKESEALIPVYDHGFLYGDGLFETIRVYNKKPFKLDVHLKRLLTTSELLRYKLPWSPEKLAEAVLATIKENKFSDAYLRVNISRGDGPPGLDPAFCPVPRLVIIARPYVPLPETVYKQGVKAIISKWERNSGSSLPPQWKTQNFLNNILGKMEAVDAGAFEGIFLNASGELTEGTVSNLFLVKREELLTPLVECGLLPGITREVVLEMAIQSGLKATESRLYLKDLKEADEAFLTNSTGEIIPLRVVDGQNVGRGIPGPVTLKLADLYKKEVEKECKNSIDN